MLFIVYINVRVNVQRIIVKFFFDKEIRFIGYLLFFLTIIPAAIVAKPWLILLGMLTGAILISMHYELTINHKKKTYRRSLFIFGYRVGRNVPFNSIEGCRIVKGQVTDLYMIGPFGIPSTKNKFHAFLEFDNGDLVEMGTSKNRVDLVKKVNKFRHRYSFPFLDLEDKNHQFDDLTTKMSRVSTKQNTGRDTLILGLVSLTLGVGMLISEFLEFRGVSFGTIIWVLVSITASTIGSYKVLKFQKNHINNR